MDEIRPPRWIREDDWLNKDDRLTIERSAQSVRSKYPEIRKSVAARVKSLPREIDDYANEISYVYWTHMIYYQKNQRESIASQLRRLRKRSGRFRDMLSSKVPKIYDLVEDAVIDKYGVSFQRGPRNLCAIMSEIEASVGAALDELRAGTPKRPWVTSSVAIIDKLWTQATGKGEPIVR